MKATWTTMPCFRWTENPKIASLVFDNYGQQGSTDLSRQIQQEHGVYLSPGSIRDYYRHEKTRRVMCSGTDQEATITMEEPVVEVPPAGAVRPDQRQPLTAADAEELYRGAMEEVERKEAKTLAQSTLTVNLTDGSHLPVGICFWSDWQLGTSGVMMRQLLADADAIESAEGLHCFVMGDLIQNLNAKVHPESLHECVLPDPRDQITCAKFILNKCKAKIHGLVDGNHENNAKRAAGLVVTEEICKELRVPYLWHGAAVNVHLDDQAYLLGLRHKFRGESGISTTNAQRMMYESWLPADVEVLGHRHYNDMQKRPKPGRDTVWLRTGSYQKWDEFGMYCGGYKGSWGIASVILYPDTKRVLPFYGSDFYTMLDILADQRARYRQRWQQGVRCA